MNSKTLQGYLLLAIANICLGINSPISMRLFISADSDHVSPFAMSGFRVIGAAALFWLLSLFTPRERVAPRDLGLILLASVFGVQLNQFLYLWGMSLTSSVDAPIIAATVPIMTMVLAMVFLREPITTLKVSGVALGAFGAIFMILADGGSLTSGTDATIGKIICIFAALSYSTYLTLFKGVITKYNPVTTMKWMFLFSALVAAVLFREDLAAVQYSQMSLSAWGTILFVVAFGTFLSFLFILKSQSIIRPTVVSMFNYVQPIAAVSFSIIIGVGIYNLQKGVATLAIFIGVWLVTKSKALKRE
ncbi:MAG: DMT family transporter [Rikenellaceae bacterium]